MQKKGSKKGSKKGQKRVKNRTRKSTKNRKIGFFQKERQKSLGGDFPAHFLTKSGQNGAQIAFFDPFRTSNSGRILRILDILGVQIRGDQKGIGFLCSFHFGSVLAPNLKTVKIRKKWVVKNRPKLTIKNDPKNRSKFNPFFR